MRIISGMHRSGTSLVARLFHEAGADLGDPSTYHPADRWNPDGYFEQTAILDVNMPLVHGLWWKLAYLRLPSPETILKRSLKIEDRIRETATRFSGKVVKETRFSLTLGAWRARGAKVDRVLCCLREPAAVAKSLVRRNHITRRHGLRLWYEHNRRLLDAAGDLPLRFVHYGDLLDAERGPGEVRGALRFFGEDAAAERAAELHALCVKPSMNHGAEEEPDYPPEVAALWENLRARHGAQSEAGAPAPAAVAP